LAKLIKTIDNHFLAVSLSFLKKKIKKRKVTKKAEKINDSLLGVLF